MWGISTVDWKAEMKVVLRVEIFEAYWSVVSKVAWMAGMKVAWKGPC